MSDCDNAAAAEPTAVTLLGTKPQSASVRCRQSRRRGPAASLALLPSPLLGAPGLRPSLRRGSPSAGRGQRGAAAGGAAVAQDSAAHGSDSFALTRSRRRAWCEGPAAASQPGAGAGSPVPRRGLLRGGRGSRGVSGPSPPLSSMLRGLRGPRGAARPGRSPLPLLRGGSGCPRERPRCTARAGETSSQKLSSCRVPLPPGAPTSGAPSEGRSDPRVSPQVGHTSACAV